jgi:hypothetical protein
MLAEKALLKGGPPEGSKTEKENRVMIILKKKIMTMMIIDNITLMK